MNKRPDKQYFVDALAEQQGYPKCLHLMPNNIDSCKLIEETLEDYGYECCTTESRRAKYITNRNNRVRRMYIVIWSDYTYDYYNVDANWLQTEQFKQYFPGAYVTYRNAKEVTLQALEAFKQHKEKEQ